jgi:hypothetical protein
MHILKNYECSTKKFTSWRPLWWNWVSWKSHHPHSAHLGQLKQNSSWKRRPSSWRSWKIWWDSYSPRCTGEQQAESTQRRAGRMASGTGAGSQNPRWAGGGWQGGHEEHRERLYHHPGDLEATKRGVQGAAGQAAGWQYEANHCPAWLEKHIKELHVLAEST